MVILPHPTFSAPPCFTLHKFFPPHKGGGVGTVRDFSPAPQNECGDEFRLFRPTLACPTLINVITVNFLYPKPYYLNKHINIRLFYSIQCGFLPLILLFLYAMRILLLWNCLVKHLDNIIHFLLKISLIWWDNFSCYFKYIFINEIVLSKNIVIVVGQIIKK